MSCGRVHSIAAGTYALTIVPGTGDDGCGIAGRGGALWTIGFDTFGDTVKANYALFAGQPDAIEGGVPLVGYFLDRSERFVADGTLPAHGGAGPVTVTGPAGPPCALDLLSVHVDATGEGPRGPLETTAFAGEIEIGFQTAAPVDCNCTSRFSFRADRL